MAVVRNLRSVVGKRKGLGSRVLGPNTLDYGLRITDYVLRITDYGLRIIFHALNIHVNTSVSEALCIPNLNTRYKSIPSLASARWNDGFKFCIPLLSQKPMKSIKLPTLTT